MSPGRVASGASEPAGPAPHSHRRRGRCGRPGAPAGASGACTSARSPPPPPAFSAWPAAGSRRRRPDPCPAPPARMADSDGVAGAGRRAGAGPRCLSATARRPDAEMRVGGRDAVRGGGGETRSGPAPARARQGAAPLFQAGSLAAAAAARALAPAGLPCLRGYKTLSRGRGGADSDPAVANREDPSPPDPDSACCEGASAPRAGGRPSGGATRASLSGLWAIGGAAAAAAVVRGQ